MLMDIIIWVGFGALAGWIASLIMRTNDEQGGIENIIVGIIGAFIGGGLARMLGGPGVSGLTFGSLLVAVMGAVILLFFVHLIGGGGKKATY